MLGPNRVRLARDALKIREDRGAADAERQGGQPGSPFWTKFAEIRERIDRFNGPQSPEKELKQRINSAECEIWHGKRIAYIQALRYAVNGKTGLFERAMSEISNNFHNSRTNYEAAYKIIAILIKTRLQEYIDAFIQQGVDDSFLPLAYGIRNKELGAFPERQPDRWIVIEGLDESDWDLFCSHQKTHFAPYFSRPDGGPLHYKFEPWDVIPIEEVFAADNKIDSNQPPQIEAIDGGFSSVSKVRLHPLSAGFGDYKFRNNDNWYAVKQLKKAREEDFLAEFYFWHLFYEEDKMVPLLCTWERPDENGRIQYYFMFPYASGTLRNLWEKEVDKSLHSEKWLFTQCWRLADTLAWFHKKQKEDPADEPETPLGRHGDVKPENVLWFDRHTGCTPPGVVALADFGISRIHRSTTMSQTNNNQARSSPTYRGPEYDLTNRKIGRSADIWALGCTYLEFVTWYLKGPGADERFSDERNMTNPQKEFIEEDCYFTITEGSDGNKIATVKGEVVAWVDELRSHPDSSSLLSGFLNYVMSKMLAIEPSDRDSSSLVAEKLEELK